ncbi:50S ribosomal protein L19 [Candidatus Daviesbacteria bacterium]|nr:50S ribosomal protein L19 [Candidatus Daviesbacteria bacterium]
MISVTFKDKNLHIGDTIRVKNTIVEGDKTRIQAFQGILIAMSGRGENKTITVRHIGPQAIGVERIWPLNARSIVDIEVVKPAKKVRRSKLYYLRNLTGRQATRV